MTGVQTCALPISFVGACIGGVCGGAVVAFFAVGAGTLGISGLPLSAATNQPLHYLWGVLTAYLVGFIAAYLLGFIDPTDENTPQEREGAVP